MIMYLLMKRYNKLKENIRKKIKSKLRNVEQKKKNWVNADLKNVFKCVYKEHI